MTAEQQSQINSIFDNLISDDSNPTLPTQTRIYTNPSYPTLSFRYEGKWNLVETKNGENTIITLSQGEQRLVLNFNMMPEVFGITPNYNCANNSNLFMSVGGDFYRVRNNSGKRTYTKNLNENYKADDGAWTSVNTQEYQRADSTWVTNITGNFKACIMGAGMYTPTRAPVSESSQPTLATKMASVNISFENVYNQNSEFLASADQLMATLQI